MEASYALTVTTLADGDHPLACTFTLCTLRDAINTANAYPDTQARVINFHAGVSGTVALTGTLPSITTHNVVLSGANNTITVSGENLYRVLTVNASASLTLQKITIANGYSTFSGGAIYNGGALTVTNSTFFNNTDTVFGGAILNEFSASLNVDSSTIVSNSATTYGGGIYNYGSMKLTNSSILSNSAVINSGGGINNQGALNVTNTTFVGNSAAEYGGGILNNVVLNVVNSTLVGNSAGNNGGGIASGIHLTMTNTIIANSPTGGDCASFGNPIAGGYNLIKSTGSSACGLTNGGNGNIIGVDPHLGPLANNGGPTLPFLPLPGSPAINAGTDAGAPAVDQRGVSRPRGGLYDIGAVEATIWMQAYLPMSLR